MGGLQLVLAPLQAVWIVVDQGVRASEVLADQGINLFSRRRSLILLVIEVFMHSGHVTFMRPVRMGGNPTWTIHA